MTPVICGLPELGCENTGCHVDIRTHTVLHQAGNTSFVHTTHLLPPPWSPLTKQGLDSEQHLHSYSNKQGLTLILASCLSPACFQGNVSEETRTVLTASTGPVPLLCPGSADFWSCDTRSHDNQVEDSLWANEWGELREFRWDLKKMRTGEWERHFCLKFATSHGARLHWQSAGYELPLLIWENIVFQTI